MIVQAKFIDGTMKVNAVMQSTLKVDAEIVNPVKKAVYDDYVGTYEVTSFTAEPLLTTSLVLATNDKHMLDDVTIYSVPTSEEYNAAGGVTITIGG